MPRPVAAALPESWKRPYVRFCFHPGKDLLPDRCHRMPESLALAHAVWFGAGFHANTGFRLSGQAFNTRPEKSSLLDEAGLFGSRRIGSLEIGQRLLGSFLALQEISDFCTCRAVQQSAKR
jgi:hypothetical protein